MDRERAETYLRVLAEAELRRAASQSGGHGERAGYADRVRRVAQVLVLVGALGEGAASQVLDDFELALGARHAGQGAPAAGWITRRAAAAGRSAAVRPDAGTTTRRPYAPVPLGQVVRVRGADADGEVWLLSYARVASGEIPGAGEPTTCSAASDGGTAWTKDHRIALATTIVAS